MEPIDWDAMSFDEVLRELDAGERQRRKMMKALEKAGRMKGAEFPNTNGRGDLDSEVSA